MPKLLSPDGGTLRVVPDRAVAAYRGRGWSDPAAVCPTHADRKADWVGWAVQSGADRDEAEQATKADLIERYGR